MKTRWYTPGHVRLAWRQRSLLSLSVPVALFCLCFLAGLPTSQAAKLSVPYYHQSTNNWCWAASTAMLAKYYRGEQFTQMKPAIVAAINDAGPQTGDNLLCSKIMGTLAFIDPARTYVRNTTIFDLGTLVRPATRDYLIAQLDLGNPLIIAWIPEAFWQSHAFLVSGYEGSDLATNHVYVHDPSGYFASSPTGPNIHVEMTWNQFFDRIEGWIPVGNNASCIHASGAQSSAGTTLSMDLMPPPDEYTWTYGQENNACLSWDGADHNGYYWVGINEASGPRRAGVPGYEATGVALWFNDRLFVRPRVWSFSPQDRSGRAEAALIRNGSVVLSKSVTFQVANHDKKRPECHLDLWEIKQRVEGEYFFRVDLFDTTQSPAALVDTVQVPVYIKDAGDALIVGSVRDAQSNPLRDATVSASVTFGGSTWTESAQTASTGEYLLCLPRGCNATISASKAGFTIPNTYIHMNCVWSTRNDFTAFPNTVSITGRVTRQDSGEGLDAVSVSFSASGGTVVTTGGGYFSNSVAYGWAGIVTPSLGGWQFSPVFHSFSSPVVVSPPPLAFLASELPVARIEATPDAFSVTEGASFGGLKVRLSENPAATVVVSVQRVSGDPDLNVTSGSSRIFNSSNWQTYQWVQISASEDADTSSGIAVIRCSAPGWASKDVVASETDNDGGSVRVFIEPAEARSAGAQWRAQSGAWHNSGEIDDTVPFFTGITIQYKDVSGWYTPPSKVTVLNSITPSFTTTGVYVPISPTTGSLRVDIEPASAVAAGAQWRVDGGAWHNTGEVVHGFSAGSHTIECSTVADFLQPGSHTVHINGGRTTENLALYSALATCVYVSPGQGIQAAIDSAGVGSTVVLRDGTFTVSSAIRVNKGITLRSQNGPDSTTIQPQDIKFSCIDLSHASGIVDGLTLTGVDTSYRDGTGNGGGARCSAGLLMHCKMLNNKAINGGGVFCQGSAMIRNCLIKGNTTYDYGGGIYLAGTTRVRDLVIEKNSCSDTGGGVCAHDTTELANCLITGNSTPTGASFGGGGVCLLNQSVLRDCVLVANTSIGGAGIYFWGGGRASGCEIRGNQAPFAAGFYSWRGALSNCVIQSNVASGDKAGGGYCEESTTIEDCDFVDNRSAVSGGGLEAWIGPGTIRNCRFTSNQAATDGGGIRVEGAWFVVNSVFDRNTASRGGAVAIGSWGDQCSLVNCTMADNSATSKGGAVHCQSSGNLKNVIAYHNTCSQGANIYNEAEFNVTYSYCCSSPKQRGDTNRDQTPNFVNSATGDYRLQSSSPCIDTGTDSGAPVTDMDGIPRPIDGDGAGGAQFDIGAYEYAPPSGSVIVRIDPVYAVDAGAKWTLDGTTWYDSEWQVDYVAAGSHTITFTNLPCWSQPGPCTIAVLAGGVVATNGVYLPLCADTDGDEIPDSWEIEYFGRLTVASFSSDFDGDRLVDYYEWRSGTDPRDPSSCIRFNEGGISVLEGQGVLLRWYSGEGMSFRVWRATNLVEGFHVIDPNVPATPPMNFYTDPNTVGHGSLFYRIELNP